MPNLPVPIVGGTYKHSSLPLSAQRTVNWFPEVTPQGRKIISLQPTPGARAFSQAASGAIDRGMFNWNGNLYKVSNATLFKIDSGGTQTSVGTINGTARCAFAGDASLLVIVTGGLVYSYDGSTLTLQTSAEFEAPDTVAYLNQQAIYDGANGRFVVSDAGALATINALNYANAESAGDALIRPFVSGQIVYMFGEESVETWWNSGAGSPPFDRVEGGLTEVGLGAMWSPASNEVAMYFLGHDRTVYIGTGSNIQRVTSGHPVFNEIANFRVVSDAIGMTFTWKAQNFYMLSFPTEGRTFCLSESAAEWFEMSTNETAHFATSYEYIYGKHLVASGGDVLEWRFDVYADNGVTIHRLRDSLPIHGGLYDSAFEGRPVTMNRLEIIMNTGVGLLTGQGSSPEIMLRLSDDGGRTFSSYIHGSVGSLGDNTYRVVFGPLGQFYNRVIRLVATDPIPWEIYSATADMEFGI